MGEFFRKQETIEGEPEEDLSSLPGRAKRRTKEEDLSSLPEKKQEYQEKQRELASLFRKKGISSNSEEVSNFINRLKRDDVFGISKENLSLFLDICEIENSKRKLEELKKKGMLPKKEKDINKKIREMAPLPLGENRPLNELFENKKLLRLLKVPAGNLKFARKVYSVNDLAGIRSLAGKDKAVELLKVPANNFSFIQKRCKIDSADKIDGLAKQEGIVQALKLSEKKFRLFLKLQGGSWNSKEEFENICRGSEEMIQSFNHLPCKCLEVAVQNQILTKENFRKIPDSLLARLDEFIDFQEINTVEEKEKIDVIRSLVCYCRHFPLAADQAIKALLENKLDIIKDEKELFEIIDGLKFFPLNIFEKYKKISFREDREKLIDRVKKMRRWMFQNRPLKIREENFGELAGLIRHCFDLEINTEEIIKYLPEIEDRTQDLKFKKDSPKSIDIKASFSYSRGAELEPGVEIDSKKIKFFQDVFRESGRKREALEIGRDEDKQKIRQEILSFLSRVARGDTITTKEDILSENLEDLALFFSISKGQVMKNLAKRRIDSQNPSLVQSYLFELNDGLGNKFENDFEQTLKSFLDENPAGREKLKQILSKDKYKEKSLKLLGCLDLADLDSEKIAKILSLLSPQRIVKRLQIEANKELEKFKGAQRKAKGTVGRRDESLLTPSLRSGEREIEMKLVPCKNKASFFASFIEGSEPIDASVFNNKNYFVFNLIGETNEGKFLRGCVQSYFIEMGVKRGLFLSEINIDSNFLYQVRADSLTDEILKAIKIFAKSNYLEGVYLSKQASPRKEICDYLNQYLFKEKEEELSFSDAQQQKISKMYKI